MVALLGIFCDLAPMNAATLAPDVSVDSSSSALMATERLVQTWVGLCNAFRQRERREIINQVPSPEKLADYREELKWMIRGARALLSLVGDPDFPVPQLLPEISGKLLQLEDSWRCLNNPMSEAEADAVLQKAFPDESRVRGLA